MRVRLLGKKYKKSIRIILISTAGLLTITCLSVYLLLHSYIHKMNLVDQKEDANKSELTDTTGDISDITRGSADRSITAQKPIDYDNSTDMEEISKDRQSGSGLQDSSGQESRPDQAAAQEQQSLPALQQDNQSPSDGKPALPQDQPKYEEILRDSQVMNLLLIGIDAESSVKSSKSSFTGSFVLFTVNKRTKKNITTTLSNNIYLQIPGKKKDRLINSFKSGGASLLIDTIEQNLKIEINGYVMTDYLAYIDIVDTIGGVKVSVKDEELEPINDNIREINEQLGDESDTDLLPCENTYLFNGKQALGYSRNWYDEDGAFIRSGKQKEIILSIFEKVKDFNFLKMNTFLNTVLPHITTDLSENDIFKLVMMLPVYCGYDLEQWSLPVKGSEKSIEINGRTVQDLDLDKNIEAIYSRLYGIN